MARGKPKTPTAAGAPTARYPQRTDLAAQAASAPPTQPIRTPTGGAYGSAIASAESQRLAPLPQPAEVPGAPMMPGTTTPMAAQGYTPPNLGLSTTPSGLPNEPLTAGLSIGAGPGPSPLRGAQFNGAALLAALAAATGDANMAELADIADSQGF